METKKIHSTFYQFNHLQLRTLNLWISVRLIYHPCLTTTPKELYSTFGEDFEELMTILQYSPEQIKRAKIERKKLSSLIYSLIIENHSIQRTTRVWRGVGIRDILKPPLNILNIDNISLLNT